MAIFECVTGGKGEKHFATLVLLTEDELLIGANIQLWLNDDIVDTKTFTSSGVINFKAEMVGEYVIKCPTVESFVDESQIVTADDLINNAVLEIEIATVPTLPPKVIGHTFTEGDYKYMVIGFDDDSVRVCALITLGYLYSNQVFPTVTAEDYAPRLPLMEKWNVTNRVSNPSADLIRDWAGVNNDGGAYDYYNCLVSIFDIYDEPIRQQTAPKDVLTLIYAEIGSTPFLTGSGYNAPTRDAYWTSDHSGSSYTSFRLSACPCFVLTRKVG